MDVRRSPFKSAAFPKDFPIKELPALSARSNTTISEPNAATTPLEPSSFSSGISEMVFIPSANNAIPAPNSSRNLPILSDLSSTLDSPSLALSSMPVNPPFVDTSTNPPMLTSAFCRPLTAFAPLFTSFPAPTANVPKPSAASTPPTWNTTLERSDPICSQSASLAQVINDVTVSFRLENTLTTLSSTD